MSEVVINQDHVVGSPLRCSHLKQLGGGWEIFLAISPEASLISSFSLLQPWNLKESCGLFLKQKQPWTPKSPELRTSPPIIQV